ncbi:MAG: germination protein YpeB, partial [Oscillospiraceae bacterium]|nr:germination protein YpeB [Oscillospiraceae bacterium]
VDALQASATVPEDLEILAVQTALVPSDGQYETLCHEFKCADAAGRHCILYVNVQTGRQEKVLLLLEDETGTLTL